MTSTPLRWLVLLPTLGSACTRHDPPGANGGELAPSAATIGAPAASSPTASAPASTPSADAGTTALSHFVASRAKLVGHTSLVLKLENEARGKAVFRAAFRQGGRRYRGEIAAYRLGLALGLGARFAEAVPHGYGKEPLRALLSAADRASFDEQALVDADGNVRGALVRWIDGLSMPEFERDPWVARWKGWLEGDAAPAPNELALAGEFSTLIVFDYLTGNFDRWSGGNLGALGEGDTMTLRYIDNDGAFLNPMPRAPLAASKRRLLATRRFSRSFVTALRALGEQSDWMPLFGREGDQPLLDAAVAAGVRERAREALAHIDQRIASAGEVSTYAFP